MQLIGMLDSPFVRRVAVSLQLLGIRFQHQSLSVFSTYDQFRKINPAVKAPTVVCDDGTVLMDSTLILQYAQTLAAPGRSLVPAGAEALLRSFHQTSLAVAACEKSVQMVYECKLRPEDKQHQPWVARVTEQLHSALGMLEQELREQPLDATSGGMEQAGVAAAVTWQFIQQLLPGVVNPADYPALAAYSRQAEALPEFLAAPHGDSTYIDRGA
jgi:glutathione S-transferase